MLQDNLTFEEKNHHLAFATQNSEISRKTKSDKGERRSEKEVEKVVSYEMLHKIMAHPSPEVVSHVAKAVRGLRIDEKSAPSPNSLNCLICTISKPTQIISRRSTTEETIGKVPGEAWSWDLIYETLAYNGNRYYSHFQDIYTGFNMVYTHNNLGETYNIMMRAFNLIKNRYQYTPKFIQLDGECTL